ncbi:MAG: hypothetical protein ABSF71_03680 [Terriglobia bacterium]|jgi:hypothetical protein
MFEVKGESFLAIGEMFGEMMQIYRDSTTPKTYEVKFKSSHFGKIHPVEVLPKDAVSIDGPMPDSYRQSLTEWSDTMVGNCHSLRLSQSFRQAKRIIECLSTQQVSIRQFLEMQRNLYDRIVDELQERVTIQIESPRANFYNDPAAFGQNVFNAFPSAHEDIAEAAKCLALDRATACVMHLCRAVEVGLKVLAVKELNLPVRNNWGRQLDDIQKELTARYRASGTRTADEAFYSEVAAQIGHIKTAWRNPTMHVERTYTYERAEEIFVAVRSFMNHLARRIKE